MMLSRERTGMRSWTCRRVLIRTMPRPDQSVGAKPSSRWTKLLDVIDNPLEDLAVPPCRAAVPGDAVAGMPLAAVDLPGSFHFRFGDRRATCHSLAVTAN